MKPGERIFDVKVQGKPAVAALDVVHEAGGRNRSWFKEITGVAAADELLVELLPLLPSPTAKNRVTLLSGIEIHAEGW